MPSPNLEDLRRSLPTLGSPKSIEDQARSVLRYVLTSDQAGARRKSDPTTCPNCGERCESLRSPYCSESCREIAGFVRQFRTGLQLGWILEHDKQVALGQVLWHALGGGRPLRVAISPPKAIEKAIKRDQGLCQVCGEPATTVDHVGSGCNRPSNLRAVCAVCCTDRAFGDPAVTGRPAFASLTQEIGQRVTSEIPLLDCDDGENWDWRAYLGARRKMSVS